MPKFKRHKIFKSGIHKNAGEQVWPPERVRGVLDATRRLSPALIPYTLLHPENSLPIYGFCRKESIEGHEVAGGYELSAVPEKFAEDAIPSLIKQGLNQISIGLGKFDELVHIGFVPNPAVSGLGTVFSESAVPCSSVVEVEFGAEDLDRPVTTAFGVSWEWHLRSWMQDAGSIFRTLREREIAQNGIEAADKFIPVYMMDFLMKPMPEDKLDTHGDGPDGGLSPAVGFVASNDNNTNSTDMGMTAEETAEFNRLRTENEQLRTAATDALNRAAQFEAEKRVAEVTVFLDSVVDRVPPSIRDIVEGILLDLQGVQPRTFAAADGTTTERSSFESLKTLLSAGPVQVVFSDVATGKVSGSAVGNVSPEDSLRSQYDAVKKKD